MRPTTCSYHRVQLWRSHWSLVRVGTCILNTVEKGHPQSHRHHIFWKPLHKFSQGSFLPTPPAQQVFSKTLQSLRLHELLRKMLTSLFMGLFFYSVMDTNGNYLYCKRETPDVVARETSGYFTYEYYEFFIKIVTICSPACVLRWISIL